jgi:3-phenylpropionate/trans-cinnamate dioxygenase ferredoxin reductase component
VIGRRMRNEHWANASAQGVTAARSMLGQDVIFDEIPYFFTDQFEFSMELSGYPPLMAEARVAYRGDPASLEFIAFWLDDADRVIAGMNVNTWDVNERVQELIRGGGPVDFARLVDPAVDLASI